MLCSEQHCSRPVGGASGNNYGGFGLVGVQERICAPLDLGSSQSCRGKAWEKRPVTSLIGLKSKAMFQTPSLDVLSSYLRLRES